MADRATRRVLMLAFDQSQILDVTGPLEILASANEITPGAAPIYDIELVAEQAGPLVTTCGLRLMADRAFADLADDELARVHTFMVAGGDGTLAALRNTALIEFVRRAAHAAERVASVCSGSAILAAAGLLDGKRATTHWSAAPGMARAFPKVLMEPDAIYVRDGKFWSSAGITAGMDLAIALIEHDIGREAALAIARRHVLYMMRPGGQSQFSAELEAQRAGGRTAKAVRFIAANLANDLTMPAIAGASGMSERTLLRAFRAELNATPADYVERTRIDAARRRLAAPRARVERVASACGFGSAETMRRAFQRVLGVSPADYRARFTTADRTSGDRHA